MNASNNAVSKFRTESCHKFWLKITAFVVGSFGPVFFLGTMLATSEPARWTMDFLSWPVDGLQSYEAPTGHGTGHTFVKQSDTMAELQKELLAPDKED